MIELYISIIVIFIFLLNKKYVGNKTIKNKKMIENFNGEEPAPTPSDNSHPIYQRFIS